MQLLRACALRLIVWRSKSHEVVDSDISLFVPHLPPLRCAKNSICDSDHAECEGVFA
jgi:hypothetical protein